MEILIRRVQKEKNMMDQLEERGRTKANTQSLFVISYATKSRSIIDRNDGNED